MGYATLKVERRGAIEILSLNWPEALNALSPEMAARTDPALRRPQSAAGRPGRPPSWRGPPVLRWRRPRHGRLFWPGAGRAQRQMAMQKLYSGVVRAMRSCPQPIIALVHGAACGAGFSLALASDVRYAATDARMNAAYIKIGLGGCDMGAGYLMPRLVGLSNASEFLLTGRFIDAERALRMGLVSEIVPGDKLVETGLALAEEMLKTAPMGLRMTKELLNAEIDAPSLEAALTIEDRQQVILIDTDDHREAVKAFREKRAAIFRDA